MKFSDFSCASSCVSTLDDPITALGRCRREVSRVAIVPERGHHRSIGNKGHLMIEKCHCRRATGATSHPISPDKQNRPTGATASAPTLNLCD
jgi:hypothetical protein